MPAPILFLSNASLMMRLSTEAASANREFNGAAMTAEVVPTAGDEVAVTTLDGVRHVRLGATSYALHLVFGQDWTAQGISTWLWTNAGLQAAVALKATEDPLGPNSPQIEGTVILAEGNYGGEAETWAEGEVTLPFLAKPGLRTSVAGTLEAPAGVEVLGDYRVTQRPPAPISAVLPEYAEAEPAALEA